MGGLYYKKLESELQFVEVWQKNWWMHSAIIMMIGIFINLLLLGNGVQGSQLIDDEDIEGQLKILNKPAIKTITVRSFLPPLMLHLVVIENLCLYNYRRFVDFYWEFTSALLRFYNITHHYKIDCNEKKILSWKI